VELLLFGGVILGVLTLWILGIGAAAAQASPVANHESDNCEECGVARADQLRLVHAAFAPTPAWPRCPACGSPDVRASSLAPSIWD
jgi:hypothetical protein